jgi:hypothetical protein
MTDTSFKVRSNLIVNTSVSINSTAIYLNATNTATINATFYTGTSNNTLLLNGLAPSQYQNVSSLPAAVANLTSNNTTHFNGLLSTAYQNVSTLPTTVLTLTSNNTSFVGVTPAASVANTTTLASYAQLSGATFTGSVNATSIADSSGNVRAIPQNSQAAAYVLTAADNGKHVSITSGGVTVPTGLATGTAITIFNNSSVSQTITPAGGVTLYLAGSSFVGARTLAQRGVVTVLCVSLNVYVIMGAGLT